MSYWDILPDDLQDYIIKIKHDEDDKDYFKRGDYYYKDITFGRIDICITSISTKTMRIFWNLNFIFKSKLTNQLTHSYTEKKRIKIRFDDDSVPYILFEYNSRCRDKLYFKQLRKLEPGKISYCWKYWNNCII